MFFWINKIRWLFTICVLLLLNNPMRSTAAEVNYYTLQMNVGGYSEMVIGVTDGTNRNNMTTINLKISGSTTDEKFGEYLMAAMSAMYLLQGVHGRIVESTSLLESLPGHIDTGIRFPMFVTTLNISQFTLDLYKDKNNGDIVLVIDNDLDQTIKLRSSPTAEEIAYFDYAVNTILLVKYIQVSNNGKPIITNLSSDKYSFSIQNPGYRY